MKACPDTNNSWRGDSVQRYDTVDVNYVMGNGEGMVAPIIAGVESRGLGSISKEIRRNIEQAPLRRTRGWGRQLL